MPCWGALAFNFLLLLSLLAVSDETVSDGFWLDGGEENVPWVSDDDGASTSAIGGVDKLAAIAGLRNNALNGGRLRADDSDDFVCGNAVTESNVDELHRVLTEKC